MERSPGHRGVILLSLLVALSLLGAPFTMADWGEQAVFSVEPVEAAELDDELPVLEYESLSEPAQDAVSRAIDAPDGRHTVYGQADWPDEFFYTYDGEPGRGVYAIDDDGQYYRLVTDVSGGFPFMYWLLEVPFVIFGLVLAALTSRASRDGGKLRLTIGVALGGLSFHLLGPAVDFPVFDPMAFVAYGATLTTLVVVLLVGRRFVSESPPTGN